MGHKFCHFMDQIPDNVSQKVETHICNDVALFKPKVFLTEPMHFVDFNIIIPGSILPDAYINGKLKSFDNGKTVVINPGESIACTETSFREHYFSLLIKPDLMKRVAEEMGHSEDIKFLELQNPFSSNLIQAIKNYDKETKFHESLPLMLDCLGIQIAVLLLREFKTNVKKCPVSGQDGKGYISLAMEYIHTFFSSNITIEDLCREIHVSPSHLIRAFKEKTEMSPHQYLLHVRIAKAEEFLRTGQYSLSETAIKCGFVSYPHFSNTFKKITGYPPTVYKRLFF